VQRRLTAEQKPSQAESPRSDPVQERLMALAQGRSGAPSGISEVARASYIDAIRAKVRQHVVVPPGVVGNPEAVFDVVQLPDGTVVEVRLVRSSGFASLDVALERAIRAASPLPTPPDHRLFARELRLILRPLAQ
jgi:colicin import membrane protein